MSWPNPEVQGRFERLEELLLILRGKSQTLTSAQATFVWQPGGTAAGNVYTSWDALFADASVKQGPRWIQFDPTFAPCTLPAGKAYNFGPLWNTYFVAATFVPVTVPATTTLHGVSVFDGIALTYAGAGVMETVGTTELVVIQLIRAASVTASGGGAVFGATGGGVGEIILSDTSQFVSGTCASTVAGGTLAISALDLCTIGANTLAQSGGGSSTAVARDSVNAVIANAQSGLPGGVLGAQLVGQAVVSNGNVTSFLPGNQSSVVTPLFADFIAPDGLAHIAATIPINAAPAGFTNNSHRLDIFVQAVSATGFFSGSYRVKAQNISGAITATGVTTNDTDDVGATGFTVVVAVSGTNVTVTSTTALNAVTSVSVQDVSGVR